MHFSNQPIMSQQHSASNHEDTGQELQLMLTSNIKLGGSVISVTLTVTWFLVPIGWFEYFKNCWRKKNISWNEFYMQMLWVSHTTVSRVYTNWCKKKKTLSEWQFSGWKRQRKMVRSRKETQHAQKHWPLRWLQQQTTIPHLRPRLHLVLKCVLCDLLPTGQH